MEENILDPTQRTLSELGARAKISRCNCSVCINLRQLVFAELENKIRAQRITISTLQERDRSESVSKDLAYLDALTHAKPLMKESESGV